MGDFQRLPGSFGRKTKRETTLLPKSHETKEVADLSPEVWANIIKRYIELHKEGGRCFPHKLYYYSSTGCREAVACTMHCIILFLLLSLIFRSRTLVAEQICKGDSPQNLLDKVIISTDSQHPC